MKDKKIETFFCGSNGVDKQINSKSIKIEIRAFTIADARQYNYG
jgi:hypothetical protein